MERNGGVNQPGRRQFLDRIHQQVTCSTNIQSSLVYLPQYQPQFCHYYNQHVFSHLPGQGRFLMIPPKNMSNKHSMLSSEHDSGISSRCSSFSQSSINKHSEFERCGDVNICIKMNSKKEMLLQVKALKADVTLSSRTKIPTILVELTSKPIAKNFQKKAEVEVLKAVNGMICLDASFKNPIDSILDVNSLTVTIFNTTKYSYSELGFVEIPVASILPNVNTGNEVLLEGWFNIYKLNKNNNSSITKEENKENETISRERRKRKHKLPSIGENYYESVAGENNMDSHVMTYSIPRGEKDNYGFTILSHSKPARIKKVDHTGTAFEAGLRVGDEILSVNGKDVQHMPADVVSSLVKKTKAADNLNISVNRRILSSNSDVYLDEPSEFSVQQRSKSSNNKNLTESRAETRKMHANVPSRELRPVEKTNATFVIDRENIYDNIPACSSKQVVTKKPTDTNKIRIKASRLKSIKASLHSLTSLTSEEIAKSYQVFDSDSVTPQAVKYSKWNPDISCIQSARTTDTESPPLRREQLFQSFNSRSDLNDARLDDLGSMPENLNATIQYETPARLWQRIDSMRWIEADESFVQSTISTTHNKSTIHSYDPISPINTTTDSTDHSSLLNESEKLEFHKCLMNVELEFQKYSNYCKDYYIDPLTKEFVLSREQMSKLFQNYEKLLEVSHKHFSQIYDSDTFTDKETLLRRLLFDMESYHRFYKEGCLQSFKFLERLFDQEEFVSFLEKYSDVDHAKPITSCLLLPLLHVINVAKCVEMFYDEKNSVLQRIIEFAEECNETIKQVSEYWDGAVERMRSEEEDESD